VCIAVGAVLCSYGKGDPAEKKATNDDDSSSRDSGIVELFMVLIFCLKPAFYACAGVYKDAKFKTIAALSLFDMFYVNQWINIIQFFTTYLCAPINKYVYYYVAVLQGQTGPGSAGD